MSDKFFQNVLILISKITTVIMLIPIVVGVYNYKKLNKPIKIFLWFCIAKFCVNLLHQAFIWAVNNYKAFFVPILNYWQIKDTNFMGILSYLTDFAFLGWYFYYVIPNENISKSIKWLSIFLFIAAITDYLFIEDFRTFGVFNPAAIAVFDFVLPVISLWFLYRENSRVPLSKNPYFWFAMGLFIPHLVSFFLYLAGDTIHREDYGLFLKISIGKVIFSIIGQILLAIGFYHARFAQFIPLKKE